MLMCQCANWAALAWHATLTVYSLGYFPYLVEECCFSHRGSLFYMYM